MPPEKHALLGASSAERWLMCPPSARLGEQFPDTASEYAAAGTLAHAIAELKARKYFVEPMSNRAFNARLKKLKEDPHYDKGMDAATDTYLEHLKALAMSYGSVQPFVALETRVDFGDCVPEGFGTTDCIIIGAGRMCVADYKNGAGVLVEAEANPQMMLYALGALKVYAPIYGDTIREVHLSIVQPNAGGVREWDTTVEALREWGEKVVKPAAALAWEGKGDFAPGEWCRFCRARARCSARAARMLELEPMKNAIPEGDSYDPEDMVLTDAHLGAGTGGVGEGSERICPYRRSARPPDRRMEGCGGPEQPGVGRPGHRLRHLAGAGHPGGPAMGAQARQRGRAGEGPGKEALRGGVLRPGGQEARQADSGAGERQAPALFAGRGGLFGG